ncbi:helix-turn-helix domain-containing protein, partial [Actinoplanes sp. NPDC051633]|uniref:helix-turn-helix domain-containing protein n=1 Tax=Actinoplanes sp. NPDC051633 TaxID=3155670 RepID=UPI00342DD0A5
LDAATRLGDDRAVQGIPLSALLGAMQASRTRALEIAIQRGRAAGLPDETLLWVLPELDRSTAALERGVINGYQAAERRLAHDRGRALRRLLRGDGATAEELGVRAERPYHCVVATPGTDLGGELYTAIDGHLAGLAMRPPAGPVSGVVIVAPAGTLAEAAERYPACVTALAAAGRPGVHHLLDLAADVALAGQPMLAGLLTGTLLAALRPDDDFHRELVTTALAYLDHGRRLDQTAAALFVHPNTVRYRLRRLREIAGPEAEPAESMTMREAVRLWWALRQWLTC